MLWTKSGDEAIRSTILPLIGQTWPSTNGLSRADCAAVRLRISADIRPEFRSLGAPRHNEDDRGISSHFLAGIGKGDVRHSHMVRLCRVSVLPDVFRVFRCCHWVAARGLIVNRRVSTTLGTGEDLELVFVKVTVRDRIPSLSCCCSVSNLMTSFAGFGFLGLCLWNSSTRAWLFLRFRAGSQVFSESEYPAHETR